MTECPKKLNNDIYASRRQFLAKSAVGVGGLLLCCVFPGIAVSRAIAASTSSLPPIISFVLEDGGLRAGRFSGNVPIPDLIVG